MDKEIQSFHYFMFPFRFDKIKDGFEDRHEFYKNHTFDKRVREAIDNDFKESLEKDGWKYQEFEIENNLDYNEVAYFYDFVKDSLFNISDFQKNATSYFFEKKGIKDKKYIIKVKNKEPYKLDLKGITLRIFDTGIGILSFEVENNQYDKLDDILKINEFGRRIYPQFLGKEFDLNDTKNSFLAEYLEINSIKDDFINNYKDINIKLPKFILKTLGDTFTTSKKKVEEVKFFIQPIIDDRMFVVCWYGVVVR